MNEPQVTEKTFVTRHNKKFENVTEKPGFQFVPGKHHHCNTVISKRWNRI